MSEQQEVVIRKVIQSCYLILCEELRKILQDILKKRKRIWTRKWLHQRSLGALSTIMKELCDQDPHEYKDVMRITPQQFHILLDLIAPRIQRTDTLMREAIPTRVKLEICLAFLASWTTFRTLSIFFRVSKASISKIIPEVCQAISECLKDYIKVPTREEWQEIQLGFSDKWNFPGCCATIDGKHVIIQAPSNCGSEYYNYKGTNSVVLVAVVDHDYCFRYVDIGSYGRNADGGVFQNSSLYPVLENNSLLPQGGVLVEDDAFPLKPYLLKPYSSPSKVEEKIYNCRLSRARRIVENKLGILASRFRIFGKPMQVQVDTTMKITKAACTLHNWLRMTSPNTYTPPGCIDYEDILNSVVIQEQWRSEITELVSIRRSRMNNRSMTIAKKLREKYKEYFVREGAVDWQNYMIR